MEEKKKRFPGRVAFHRGRSALEEFVSNYGKRSKIVEQRQREIMTQAPQSNMDKGTDARLNAIMEEKRQKRKRWKNHADAMHRGEAGFSEREKD